MHLGLSWVRNMLLNAFLCLYINSIHSAFAEDCQIIPDFREVMISKPERMELCRTQKEWTFRIEVFSGNIYQKEKVIVLLGETHLKSRHTSNQGKNLLQHFRFRGLESPPFRYAFEETTTEVFYRSLDRGPLAGSTIRDAEKQGLFFSAGNQVFFDGEELIKKTSEDDFAINANSKAPFPIESFPNLDAIVDPFLFAAHIQAMNALQLVPELSISIERPINVNSKVILDVYNVKGRNDVMVENIMRLLHAYDTLPVLLVIIGLGHYPGIKKMLVEKHEFAQHMLKETT